MLFLLINQHYYCIHCSVFRRIFGMKSQKLVVLLPSIPLFGTSVWRKLSTNNPSCNLEHSQYSVMYIFRDVSTKFTINFKLPTWWHHKGMFVSILSEKWPINLWFPFIVLIDKLIPLGGYGVLLQGAPTISKRGFCAHLADKVKSNQRV